MANCAAHKSVVDRFPVNSSNDSIEHIRLTSAAEYTRQWKHSLWSTINCSDDDSCQQSISTIFSRSITRKSFFSFSNCSINTIVDNADNNNSNISSSSSNEPRSIDIRLSERNELVDEQSQCDEQRSNIFELTRRNELFIWCLDRRDRKRSRENKRKIRPSQMKIERQIEHRAKQRQLVIEYCSTCFSVRLSVVFRLFFLVSPRSLSFYVELIYRAKSTSFFLLFY